MLKNEEAMVSENNLKQGKWIEFISYNVVVVKPRRISIRNINSGKKNWLGSLLKIKALTIQY